jgi:energy-coupling factor transporter ATP-binding protein EcfA2
MSLVAPSERLVALPKDEKPADSAAEDVIVVDELRMRYGGKEAVAGITFRVARGEIFALLGPNGAGKTTTVEILEGFRERNDGTVSVLGVDPSEEEHLLSRADANARGGRQMSEPSGPRNYLRAAATSRVRLLPNRNGKEGVDGSSPPEGSAEKRRTSALLRRRLGGYARRDVVVLFSQAGSSFTRRPAREPPRQARARTWVPFLRLPQG